MLLKSSGKDKFMKIKLKNDTIITVLDSTTPTLLRAEFQSITELDAFRAELTNDNLSVFQYVSEDDSVMGSYENYTLVNTSYTVADGIYSAVFSLRQFTDTELRLNTLEEEQELQNGAIEELAGIVGGE